MSHAYGERSLEVVRVLNRWQHLMASQAVLSPKAERGGVTWVVEA